MGLVPLIGVDASAAPAPTPFGDARLKIEYNATDGDAGLQVFLDAGPWRRISITNPQGRPVVEVEEVIKRFGVLVIADQPARGNPFQTRMRFPCSTWYPVRPLKFGAASA